MFGFPTFITYLFSPEAKGKNLSSLKVIMSGGATVSTALREELKANLPNIEDIIVVSSYEIHFSCTAL